MSSLGKALYGQLILSLPYPSQSFTGRTVIVTGSNVGLGKEAARHFTRLGASTVILAVRSIEKGEAAKADIEKTTGTTGVVQVWKLDLSSYQSVKDFAARATKELERIDVLLENAAIATRNFDTAEGDERTITVNVISTFLLAFLMFPKLKQTARDFNTRPVLDIVSSDAHAFVRKFPEGNAPEGQIFKTLSDKETANMGQRYPVSKLLEIFIVQELGEQAPADKFPITVNTVNPGLCHSELAREGGWSIWLLKLFFARSTEAGSRTLFHACCQGSDTHGAYLSDCAKDQPSSLVRSDEGKTMQKRIWKELLDKLEQIQAGVTENL